jgi:hypothetical protein
MAYFLHRLLCGLVSILKWLIMNKRTMYRGNWRLSFSGVLFLLFLACSAFANEETFSTLEVGSHVYKNVTVTTKAKNYIFIYHSTGMENIRVSDLPEEIRTQLGYVPEVTKSQKASDWAKGKMADLHIGNVKAEELRDPKKLREQTAIVLEKVRSLDHKMCGAFLGGALLIYFFYCYCCAQICQKARAQSAVLVWFPVLKVLALLRAARMSPVWFVFYVFGIVAPFFAPFMPPPFGLDCLLICVFVLNLVLFIGTVIWCLKIARARGKSPGVGVCLLLLPISPLLLAAFRQILPTVGILPMVGLCLLFVVISIFAFLYLAFSDRIPEPSAPKEDNRTEHLMTLETA